MISQKTAKAQKLADQLNQNVDDLYADRIDHDQHRERNATIWREVEAAGLRDAVLDLAWQR